MDMYKLILSHQHIKRTLPPGLLKSPLILSTGTAAIPFFSTWLIPNLMCHFLSAISLKVNPEWAYMEMSLWKLTGRWGRYFKPWKRIKSEIRSLLYLLLITAPGSPMPITPDTHLFGREIGRASCRERAQYE